MDNIKKEMRHSMGTYLGPTTKQNKKKKNYFIWMKKRR